MGVASVICSCSHPQGKEPPFNGSTVIKVKAGTEITVRERLCEGKGERDHHEVPQDFAGEVGSGGVTKDPESEKFLTSVSADVGAKAQNLTEKR